jgi:uracil-DNA glycosylase
MKNTAEEYRQVVRGLKDSLEYMRSSGVNWFFFRSTDIDGARNEAVRCTACELGKADGVLRVFGAGGDNARLVFIRDSADKNSADSPFAGDEGEQLLKILNWIVDKTDGKLASEKDAYVTYGVKCVARGAPDEAYLKCSRILRKELACVTADAAIILVLGQGPALSLLGSTDVKKLRGRVHNFGKARLIATHGLVDIINASELKKEAQADFQLAIDLIKRDF